MGSLRAAAPTHQTDRPYSCTYSLDRPYSCTYSYTYTYSQLLPSGEIRAYLDAAHSLPRRFDR